MLPRVFVPLSGLLSIALLAGCANQKQAQQSDSSSIIREPESPHEVHGEVGVMYGTSAR
jgi:uncharacterized lipoprotein YajG